MDFNEFNLDGAEMTGMLAKSLTSKGCDFSDFWFQMAQKWRKENEEWVEN
jgi:hypothetical protein